MGDPLGSADISELESLRLRIAALERQNAEYRNALAALQDGDSLWKTVVSNAPVVLWALDQEGIITLTEGSALGILGVQPADFLGRSVFTIYADHPEICDDFRKVLAGEPLTTHRFLNGCWFETRMSPLFDSRGVVTGVIGVSTDTTERVRAEQSLARSELLFREIVQNASDAILVVDYEGRITFANPRCQKLFETSPEEMIGRHFLEFTAEQEQPVLRQRFERRMRGEEVERRYEARLRTQTGSLRWADISVSLLSREGEASTLVLVRDITQRKRGEAKLLYRERFEQLITSFSTQFINLPLDEIDSGLRGALGAIGAFAGADRSYIFLLDETGQTMSNTHEWCATGVAPHSQQLQEINLDSIPWFRQELFSKQVVHVPRVADMPPEATLEREHFAAQGIQSLVVVSMLIDREPIGCVGFDAVRTEKRWSQDVISLLRIVGEIFANALARKQAEADLQASEERFRRLVEHATDAFYVYDLEGRIVDVNQHACVSLLYSREELLRMSLSDIDATMVPERIEEMWKRMLPGVPLTIDGTHRRKDGTSFPVEMHAGLFSLGERQLVLALARDITERKRQEDALRAARDELELRVQERTAELRHANAELQRSEAKWRSLVQNAPDFIMTVARNGTILFVNRMASPLAVDNVLGRTVYDFAPPDQHEGIRTGLEQVFATGEPHDFEIRSVGNDGRTSWFAGRMGAVREDGEVTAAILITTDITLRKRAEEESKQHQADLAHIGRLSTMGEMAAEMAHELNQPLAAIANYANGCIRRLKLGADDAETLISVLDEVTAQANRASRIISEMRDFVRKRAVVRSRVDINQCVRSAISLAEIEAKKYGIRIHAELAENLSRVNANAIQIEQVVLNLLLNAIDATQQKELTNAEVAIRTELESEDVIAVAVIDRGRGISPEHVERIFDPFFTTKTQGLGMGLSISRSIVESHDGRLCAVANPAGGTTFRFTLPILTAGPFEEPCNEPDC